MILFRKVEGLETQLEHERLKREALEAELDQCRHEIVRLINSLRSLEEKGLGTVSHFMIDQANKNG